MNRHNILKCCYIIAINDTSMINYRCVVLYEKNMSDCQFRFSMNATDREELETELEKFVERNIFPNADFRILFYKI